MKRSRVLALATASSLVVFASVGGVASAANSKLATQTARAALSALSAGGGEDDGGTLGKVVHGTIGSALPSTNAAANLRSLGGGDEGSGSDDGGSLGKVVHGTIGNALPGKNAASSLRSLGADN
jgi:hypothetical protein